MSSYNDKVMDDQADIIEAQTKRIAELEALNKIIEAGNEGLHEIVEERDKRIAELEEAVIEIDRNLGPAKPTCDGCAYEIQYALVHVAKVLTSEQRVYGEGGAR